ncbi:translation initiation factor IF-6 [Candidatus Hikarchaeum yamanae]|uniref:translation initiation factor IF-6 n=1 Tax=Candidatus Hikarchaeum yamanae TaxID=2675326 RepID=UPI0039EA2991
MFQTNISSASCVGVFLTVTDDYLFIMPNIDEDLIDGLCSELRVDAIETTIGGSITTGALLCGNNSGLLTSSQLTASERKNITSETDLPLKELPGDINAVGNIVLANDQGACAHGNLSDKAVSTIEQTLDVPVIRCTIAGIPTVGTAAVATNNGVLCPPLTSDSELNQLQKHFGTPVDVGSINYGGPLIGSGLVANIHGYVSGGNTTGPELGRIEETLGFLSD